MSNKRKRSPNWQSSEKNLLLKLVQQHLSIIESKRTDTDSLKKKAAEWNIMCNKYNSQTVETHRTAENIKAHWDKMKKSAMMELYSRRRRLKQTGEGLFRPRMQEPFYHRVLSLLEQRKRLRNSIDNDASNTGTECKNTIFVVDPMESHNSENIKVLEVSPFIPVSTPAAVEDCDWGNYTTFSLQTTGSNNLRVEKRNCMPKNGMAKKKPGLSVSSLQFKQNKKNETHKVLASDERQEAKSLHDINMQIKQEELQIKKEELKQNKIKTRLLLLQLRLKRKRAR